MKLLAIVVSNIFIKRVYLEIYIEIFIKRVLFVTAAAETSAVEIDDSILSCDSPTTVEPVY